ncbi:MAG: hypothetical protein WKH68_10245 [Candidatus Limnocylindria bacterium]
MLAAAGLVLGPLLFLLDGVIDPAWADDDAAYLAEVASSRTAYITAELASTIGALLLIAGMVGVMRVMRGPRVTFGQVAAGVVTVGLIGLTGSLAFSVFDLAMAGFDDRGAMVELRAELQDSGPYRAFWLAFSAIATLGGLILLAIALYRRRIVARWAPAAVCVAILLWYLGGSEQALYTASWVLLSIAFAPLAARIWSLGDDAWAQWETRLGSEADGRNLS